MSTPKDDDPELQAASRTGFEIALNHLIECGVFPDRPSALYGAYRNAHVRHYCNQMAGTVKRLVLKQQEQRKEAAMSMPQQTRDEFLTSVVKQYGAVAIAKHVLDVGPRPTSPSTSSWPRAARTSSSCTRSPGEDGLTLRKALTLIKNAQWAAQAERGMRKVGPVHGPRPSRSPSIPAGRKGRGRDRPRTAIQIPIIGNVGDSGYDQLVALCNAELKRRGLSSAHFARVFSEIYTSPDNAQLAMQERRENRPGGVERMAT